MKIIPPQSSKQYISCTTSMHNSASSRNKIPFNEPRQKKNTFPTNNSNRSQKRTTRGKSKTSETTFRMASQERRHQPHKRTNLPHNRILGVYTAVKTPGRSRGPLSKVGQALFHKLERSMYLLSAVYGVQVPVVRTAVVSQFRPSKDYKQCRQRVGISRGVERVAWLNYVRGRSGSHSHWMTFEPTIIWLSHEFRHGDANFEVRQ